MALKISNRTVIASAIFLTWLFTAMPGFGQHSGIPFSEPGWVKASNFPLDADFLALSKTEGIPNRVFLASRKNLYRSHNGGKTWEPVFRANGEEKISSVYACGGKCFLILDDGKILLNENGGGTWEEVLSPPGTRNVKTVSVNPEDEEIVFLGTGRGLYWSLDNGRNWTKQNGVLGNHAIGCVFIPPQKDNLVFVAAGEDLYRSDNYGRSFLKTFHLTREKTEAETEDTSFYEETLREDNVPLQDSLISAVKVSPKNPEEFLLATAEGVFVSRDAGESWAPVPRTGLAGQVILDLEISPGDGTLFAATEKGVHCFPRSGKTWTELYRGLAEKTIGKIILLGGERESLLTASRHALFRWTQEWLPPAGAPSPEYTIPPGVSQEELTVLFAKEPSVREVQKAAVRYNGVGNGKITRWQIASRLKALVPDISLNRYFSSHNTIDLDRGGTNDPDTYILGPESSSTSDSLNLSWDLKDLIWSSDQTSIDSRQKLMVELREEILGEITRLYFERKRALKDFFLLQPQNQKDRLEALLRIEELTAYLDGLTGGYLTKELEKRGIKYT